MRKDTCYQRDGSNGSALPERHTMVPGYPHDIDEESLTAVDDGNEHKGFILDINKNQYDKCRGKVSLRVDGSNICPWSEVTNGHHSDVASAQRSCSKLSDPEDIGVVFHQSKDRLNLEKNPLQDNEEGELQNFNQESKRNNSPDMDLLVCRKDTDSFISKDLEHSGDDTTGDSDRNFVTGKSNLSAKWSENSHVGKQNTWQMKQHTDSSASLLEHCNRMEPRSKNPIETSSYNAELVIDSSSSVHIDTHGEDFKSQLPQEDSFEKETHQVDKLADPSEHPLKRPLVTKIGHFVTKSEFR